jgi:hypothetical protein
MRVTGAATGSPHGQLLRGPVESGLRPGVAVVHELHVGAGVATRQRHAKRVADQIGAHVCGERPADDAARVRVDDEAEQTSPSWQRR